MCERIEQLADALAERVRALDPAGIDAATAVRLVDAFSRIEHVAAAGRTVAAGRVAETRAWRASSARSAAHFLAQRTRDTVGAAVASLHTARALGDLTATREAFCSGRLSGIQAAEIASAAAADPSAEASLLEAAHHLPVKELRIACAEVRAAAAGDEDAAERLRRGRYLRHWTDRDGAVRLDGRFAPDDGARLLAAVTAGAARLAAEARRSGLHEPLEAFAADALVGLARGERVRSVVHVEVDAAALERGRTEAGERCRIPGVGPVPVGVARRFAAEGVVKLIERNGTDVSRVSHPGRVIPAKVRTALEARDPVCVVPGCDVRSGLEIDHIVPFARGGPTMLANLARLCRFHHAQKTHHGWRLGGAPGAWTWTRTGHPSALPRAP